MLLMVVVGCYNAFTVPICTSVGPSVTGMSSRALLEFALEFQFHMHIPYTIVWMLIDLGVKSKILHFWTFSSEMHVARDQLISYILTNQNTDECVEGGGNGVGVVVVNIC